MTDDHAARLEQLRRNLQAAHDLAVGLRYYSLAASLSEILDDTDFLEAVRKAESHA